MNERAQKKARQAELENYLLHMFYKAGDGGFGDFVQWLEYQSNAGGWNHTKEARELIALYEGME